MTKPLCNLCFHICGDTHGFKPLELGNLCSHLPSYRSPASAPPPVLLTQRERELYDESGFVLAAAPVLSPAEVRFHGDLWEALYAAEGELGNGFSINVSRELPLRCSVSSDGLRAALSPLSPPALPLLSLSHPDLPGAVIRALSSRTAAAGTSWRTRTWCSWRVTRSAPGTWPAGGRVSAATISLGSVTVAAAL